VVDYARANNIKPKDFPYAQAQRIYLEAGHDAGLSGALPMTETEFRTALDPVAIIENRATAGGPQASEMTRMLTAASQKLAEQDQWIMARRSRIDASLAKLDSDFARLAQK
jgi:argininosuccinate lyase